jgi:hypothetical protein
VTANAPNLTARLPQWLTGATPQDVAADVAAARLQQAGATPQDVVNYFAEGERASRFNSNSYAVNQQLLADANPELTRLPGGVY